MEEALRELGFSDNEAVVYLTLLKTGPMSSYALSEKTSLNRGYLYELLKKLHEKAVVSEMTIEGKKHYQASNPEQLRTIAEFKLESVQNAIPQLQQIARTWAEEVKIDVYKGKYCLKTLINDELSVLKQGGEILVIGIDEQLILDIDPQYIGRYFRIIQQRGIRERVLIKEGTTLLEEAKTTEYRQLPEKYTGKIVQFIYGNKVALITLTEPLNLIIIESQDIADTYRTQFEVFWKMGKKIRIS